MTGYFFRGRSYCSDCIADAMYQEGVVTVVGLMVPSNFMLERVASDIGINRDDEESFTSHDFPKDFHPCCFLCFEALPHNECVPEECSDCGEELQ